MYPHCECSSRDTCQEASAEAASYLIKHRGFGPHARLTPQLWPKENTCATERGRPRWQLPLLGYLVALFLEVAAASLTLLVVHHLPIFALQGTLILLGIVCCASIWGRGAGLFATLVGTALLELVVLPSALPWFLTKASAGMCVAMFLLVGLSISLVASQNREAGRRAAKMADLLGEAHARAERERLRLRTVLDVLPAAVGMMDAQARVLETNPASKALWGEGTPQRGERAEVQKWRGWWPDTRQPLAPDEWAITRALTRGESTINQEVEVATSTGQRKVILDSAVPIRDEQGIIIGGVGIHQDITERKRLEEALRESERRAATHASELEAIFEALTDGLFVYDAQGRILRCNVAARHLFGFEVQPDFVSLPYQERALRYAPYDEHGQPLSPEQMPPVRMLRGEVFTGDKPAEVRIQTLDGREAFISATGTAMRDVEGAITGAVLIARDVTEQRRLEQHTHQTLNTLLAMAEALVEAPGQASDGLLEQTPRVDQIARRLAELTRSVLGCKYVSIAAIEPETMLMRPITVAGLSPEDEAQWWASWYPPLRFGQHLQPENIAALCGGEPVLRETSHLPPPLWQRICPGRKSLLVPMRMGETLVGMLRVGGGAEGDDYTCANRQALVRAVARLGALVLERERLLRERAEARASELALRETNAQMDTFLGMAGHELKTPLTSLKLALQLVARRMRQSPQAATGQSPSTAPVLEQVMLGVRQAERLDRLVNDLLDVSRIRAGKLELHLERADLTSIVYEAVEDQRRVVPQRSLFLQLPTDRPLLVTADADRIGEVVVNYLTNALKYSPTDRPVEVGLAVEDQQARVWVRDEGPGLPPEEQQHIWERFQRARGIEVQSGSGIGLGLGLYICRTIIERHQGRVGVESAPGQGSTFWFTLPLAR